VLELSGDRIHSMNADCSDRKTIVTDCHLPDGIVVDAEAGHIYWTNMGIPNLDDGSIERAYLSGGNCRVIVFLRPSWAELKRQSLIEQNAPVPEGGT
jgi:hypothetical protein